MEGIIRRRRFIACWHKAATVPLPPLHPLTYGKSVYGDYTTGTLDMAAQVNAVSINASSIKVDASAGQDCRWQHSCFKPDAAVSRRHYQSGMVNALTCTLSGKNRGIQYRHGIGHHVRGVLGTRVLSMLATHWRAAMGNRASHHPVPISGITINNAGHIVSRQVAASGSARSRPTS